MTATLVMNWIREEEKEKQGLGSRVLGHMDLQTRKTEPGPGQEGSQIKSSPSDTAGVRHPVDLGR